MRLRKEGERPIASTLAYCLLGSNLDDRVSLLREAALLLAGSPRIEVTRVSRIYETPPWGKTDQPPFLNAAVELRTTLPPEALLNRFHEIERCLGRERGTEGRWEARRIDIDLALYGDEIVERPGLSVPHPHLAKRAFALVPLLEIAPELRDPRTREPYARSLERLGAEAVHSCLAQGPLFHDAGQFGKEGTDFEPGLYLSQSPKDTRRVAAAMAAAMRGGDVVALIGALGAGKTCFAGGFASGLGIAARVTSPSYVLVKSYEGGRLVLHHADFYRLAGGCEAVAREDGACEAVARETGGSPSPPQRAEPPDMAGLGLEDYLDDSGAVVLVEWADRFPEWLEPPFWLVEIAMNGPNSRFLYIRPIATRQDGRLPRDGGEQGTA